MSLLAAKKKLLMAQGGAGRIIGVAVGEGSTTHNRIDKDGNTLTGSQYNFGGSFYDGHGAFNLTAEMIDGQQMIKVPVMWYRRATLSTGPNAGKEAWWVADYPAEGFTRHPAFMNAGNTINHLWIGKYQGVNDGGIKLGSSAGAQPLYGPNFNGFKSAASARNVGGQIGWMLWSIYQLAVVQMLVLIETASTDCQAAIGAGNVASGGPESVSSLTVSQATYRGLVGLWGNISQYVDGIRLSGTFPGLWDRSGNKGWVSTTLLVSLGGYVITMSDLSGDGYDSKDIFLANAAAGDGFGAGWRDFQALNTFGENVAVGGHYGQGDVAGIWAARFTGGADIQHGARLAKEP